jgi:hypothetical protein
LYVMTRLWSAAVVAMLCTVVPVSARMPADARRHHSDRRLARPSAGRGRPY